MTSGSEGTESESVAWNMRHDRTTVPSRHALVGFAVSAIVGLAIWLPTMAMQPRYDSRQQGSPWYWFLMIGAAAALGVAFRKRVWVVAPGLIALQLVLAPFTTPRGDNSGLWVLMIPGLVFFLVPLALVSRLAAQAADSNTP